MSSRFRSQNFHLWCHVPQGSVLGPVLFSFVVAGLVSYHLKVEFMTSHLQMELHAPMFMVLYCTFLYKYLHMEPKLYCFILCAKIQKLLFVDLDLK